MTQSIYKFLSRLLPSPENARIIISIVITSTVICHYISITRSNNFWDKIMFSGSYRLLIDKILIDKAGFTDHDTTVYKKSNDSIYYNKLNLQSGGYFSSWRPLVNNYKFWIGPDGIKATHGRDIVLDTGYHTIPSSELNISFKIHSAGVLGFASNVDGTLYPSLPSESPAVFLNSMKFELFAKKIEFENLNFRHSSFFLTSKDAIMIRNCSFKNSIIFVDSVKYAALSGYLNNVQMNSDAEFTSLNHINIDSSSSITFKRLCFISDISGIGKIRVSKTEKLLGELILGDVDLSYLVISDPYIHLSVDQSLTDQAKIKMYKQLVVKYEDVKDLKKEYDIGLQRLNYKISGDHFMPWVRECWDNFGYDKSLIFINSIYLMLFFFSINLLCYPKMIRSGYHLKEFATADTRIKAKYSNNWRIEIGTAFYCLVYTFFIFWGLKLNVEKLRVSNIWYTILILIQYFVGIVCLAYIANIVITR